MSPDIIAKMTSWLNKLPLVRWDRMNQKKGHAYVFGWMEKDEHSKDFFIIDFVDGDPVDYCSSNISHNVLYCNLLGLYTEPCKRIEAIFPDVQSVVKLEK
jgi:hypothetical protein